MTTTPKDPALGLRRHRLVVPQLSSDDPAWTPIDAFWDELFAKHGEKMTPIFRLATRELTRDAGLILRSRGISNPTGEVLLLAFSEAAEVRP